MTKKNYVKIFFIFTDRDKTIAYYKQESERYLLPNLYNSNDYNYNDEGIILGLPNNNMGMNSKKPYLENKTRKIKVPYLLDQQKALLQSQFFDYLLGEVSKGKYNFYINNFEGNEDIKAYTDLEEPDDILSGYYLRCRKEKNEVEIVHADNVSCYSKALNEPFILKNYIGISQKDIDKSTLPYDTMIDNLWQIRHLIDSIFFEGRLQFNLYSRIEDIQINDVVLKRCLLENRDVLSAWFYEGKDNLVKSSVDKFSMQLIKNAIINDETFKAQRQFNLRWSLLSYFKDKRRIGENMEDIREKLRQHINSGKDEKWTFDSDEEFSYAVGQIAEYFLSLNRSNNKSAAYINTFLNAKNAALVKKKVQNAYKKYNYAIYYIESSRVQQLVEHIMMYEPHKIYTEYILAGFCAAMLVYEKNKEEDNNE